MRRSQSPAVRTWHVFARGARRLALFYEETDYRHFLMFLQEALILSGCALFGYVLMGNHYHLMLRGSQAQISTCMKRLNWRYALFHNDTHQLGGHVFDGPYKSHPQRSLRWLLWKLAYIFLNPVTAHLAGDAGSYRWSGFLSFMGRPGSPLDVTPLPEMELGLVGKDLAEAREHFLFILKEQQAAGISRGSSTPTAREIQMDQFAWLIREAEARVRRVAGVDKENLALWWGKETGVPPRVMARALGIASSDAVRMRIRRFTRFLEANPDLASLLAL